jgi:hypothetical protein
VAALDSKGIDTVAVARADWILFRGSNAPGPARTHRIITPAPDYPLIYDRGVAFAYADCCHDE